jgi:hypothetical protein
MDNGLHSNLVLSGASSIQKRCELNSHSPRISRTLRFLKSKLALSALNVTRAPPHDIVSSISIGSLVRGLRQVTSRPTSFGKCRTFQSPPSSITSVIFSSHYRHYRLTIILSLQIYHYSCCRQSHLDVYPSVLKRISNIGNYPFWNGIPCSSAFMPQFL